MISVITRTKDRQVFLPRVFKSLLEQTYRPIEWIVVNDAGEDISELIAQYEKEADEGFTLKYVYKENSTTMEAATNLGLENANGTYINILDDDDTIDKSFYSKMITYLENNKIESIRGAISYSQYIYEEVVKGTIRILDKKPFEIRPNSLTLMDILKHNQFPIHAFIYKKSSLEKVGLYDELYPVLGDWEFNIRFIEQYDIGIVPEVLISYHKRVNDNYANTDKTALNEHLFYDGLIRNKIIRTHKNLSDKMAQGSVAKDMNTSFCEVKSMLDECTSVLKNELNLSHKLLEKRDAELFLNKQCLEQKVNEINTLKIELKEIFSNQELLMQEKIKIIKLRDSELLARAQKIEKNVLMIKHLEALSQSMRIKNRMKSILRKFIPSKLWKFLKLIKNNRYLIRKGFDSLRKKGLSATFKSVKRLSNLQETEDIIYDMQEQSDKEKKTGYRYIEDFEETELLEKIQSHEKCKFAFIIKDKGSLEINAMIHNILEQLYGEWTLYVLSSDIKGTKNKIVSTDTRIHIVQSNMDKCVDLLKEKNIDYVLLLEKGTLLTRDCLYEVNLSVCKIEANARVIYCDHDEISINGQYVNPHYKTDFSLLYFLSYNYLGNALFFAVTALSNIKEKTSFELVLDVLEDTKENNILHIPKILSHEQRNMSYQVLEEDKGKAQLIESFLNKNLHKSHVNEDKLRDTFKLEFEIKDKPLVSIIIPFKDQHELLESCVESIYQCSSYENFEVIGISNNSTDKRTFNSMKKLENSYKNISFFELNIPFNYSKINNIAVEKYANGKYILFLNNDIKIISKDWIESLLSLTQLEKIGCVGAKLRYPNETIQHAGVTLGVKGFASHIMNTCASHASGYDNRLSVMNNYSAVTAACLMIEKDLFTKVGMFNDVELPVKFNDIDLC
ncbi:glycosyltransferase [Sulfurimonas sp. MAG313]|nr:glycosyltransferase [Sulfurimonas sp. MAG313]MDF1881754.1 glycosyltransferase [Sulfurimonas sp. MAG313]